jgi:dTDP-4-amino-4,6-dideoxygalactose transaminase
MTDMQAALGQRQLRRLGDWIDRRAERACRYDAVLADLPLALPPPAAENTRHGHHLYRAGVTDDSPLTRDEQLERLRKQRIGAGVHYRGVYLHGYYRRRFGLTPETSPYAARDHELTLRLPLSPGVRSRIRRTWRPHSNVRSSQAR